MTTWFVSRHPGAIEWAKRKNIKVDQLVQHLNILDIEQNDIVIGSLPVNLVAEVCQKGATYWHLSLEVPFQLRGLELSSDQLFELNAQLQAYNVQKIF